MGKEQLLELNLPPAPPQEQDNEKMTFLQIFRQAVDTLFTQQPITNTFSRTAGNEAEIENFVRQRKEKLCLELVETARLEMVRFLADLKEMKGNRLENSSDQTVQTSQAKAKPTISSSRRPDF